MGPSQVVITLGADGALAFANGKVFRQDALVIEALDTVGAGDAFVAG
ncbi:PfkB family carbohydrate kinase [Arthrobacter sp. 2RAF6]